MKAPGFAETLNARRDLCDRARVMGATLNGKPANVQGAAERFALVRALDQSASAFYAWDAVVAILDAGGKFRT